MDRNGVPPALRVHRNVTDLPISAADVSSDRGVHEPERHCRGSWFDLVGVDAVATAMLRAIERLVHAGDDRLRIKLVSRGSHDAEADGDAQLALRRRQRNTR